MKLYPRIKQSGRYRCFQSNWFKNYPWLEYSEVLDKCFCFPCRVFSGNQLNAGQIDKTFSKTGFTNWYKGIESFRKHQLSKSHVNSVNSMKNYLNEAVLPIDQLLDETRKVILAKKETERIQNRKLMERIIDIIICLAKCGKSFRGHNESLKSNQKGLFLEIIQLLSRYDPILRNHFDNGPKNAQYTSNHIQNDLITSIHNVLKQSIKTKIHQKWISIMADETSDVGHHEQLAVLVRYFDTTKNRPVETFLSLKRLKSLNAVDIFNTLSDIVTHYNISWTSVLAVCFDGASTMSGKISGVQARCKAENNKIIYVHCYAHCLNLALIDSISKKSEKK